MRVSDLSRINFVVDSLNKSGLKADEINQQMASGKKINKPSDDPPTSALVESLKSAAFRNDAALRNSKVDKWWLDSVDESTARMIDLLRYAKSKALEAANSYQNPDTWGTIATEVEHIKKELFDLGNTKINNVYIYSGSKTFTPPLADGWPYQLPAIEKIPNLLRSKAPVDDLQIRNFNISEDEDELAKPILVDFATNFDKPEVIKENPNANLNPYELTNPGDEPSTYQVRLSRNDSAKKIVEKLNDALAGKYFHTKDDRFATGLKQDAYFYVGPDNRIYAQAIQDVELSLAKNFNNLIPMEQAPTSEGVILHDGQEATGYFGEYVSGYSDIPINVKITKAGKIGEAMYSVSNDEGQTWSPNRLLKWENELFNPDGTATTGMTLNFSKPDLPLTMNEGFQLKLMPNLAVKYQGNVMPRNVPLDGLYKSKINITGQQLFYDHDSASVNVFDVLSRLKTNIENGRIDEIAKEIKPLDIAVDQILLLRSKSGITTRDIDQTEQRVTDSNFNSTKSLSDLEDADMAKAATDLNLNTAQRQAIMESSARILQPTLVQFLR